MAKYRKKPVVVVAYQWKRGQISEGVHIDPANDSPSDDAACNRFFVVTIHGQRAYLEDKDWIIEEPDGIHHYPCKPDIFENTYEKEEA